MPSNYSDNPSMDEILNRIKRALSEREAKSSALYDDAVAESGGASGSSALSGSVAQSVPEKVLTFEEMRELSSSKEMTDKIVGNLVDDEIFIKPVAVAKPAQSGEPVSVVHLEAKEKVVRDDVFVLTKSMKKKRDVALDFSNVDVDLFCKNISVELGRDLAISYLVPKIESWFKLNLSDAIAKSQKK